MTVRRRLLPAVLCLLAGYSLTAAAYNTSSSCTGTGNTTFSLPNLTFNTNQLPAVGAVLYTSPAYPVSYMYDRTGQPGHLRSYAAETGGF